MEDGWLVALVTTCSPLMINKRYEVKHGHHSRPTGPLFVGTNERFVAKVDHLKPQWSVYLNLNVAIPY